MSASAARPRRRRSRRTRVAMVASTRPTSAPVGGGAGWKRSVPPGPSVNGFEGFGFMTANLFVRKTTVERVGGFNERFDRP